MRGLETHLSGLDLFQFLIGNSSTTDFITFFLPFPPQICIFGPFFRKKVGQPLFEIPLKSRVPGLLDFRPSVDPLFISLVIQIFNVDKREAFGFKVHSFSTFDKIKKCKKAI